MTTLTERQSRPILITGCSSGIGHCVALGLQQRGYPVIASARAAADVESLQAAGLQAVQLDLDDSASIQAAVAATLALTQGRLYGLFNNGAYGQPGAVEDLSRAALRAQLETNLLGWHELTCAVLPVMRQQGEGRIIQNSSVLGLVGFAYRGAYVCSKYALEGLTDTLRLELHGTGIAVSLIEPGPIESRFRANAQAKFLANIEIDQSAHRAAYRAALQRLQQPGPVSRHTLPPEAVLQRVIHALESPRPRPRYAVTTPTYVIAALRRLLPTRWLDRFLRAASAGGAN